jgi:hypothetical protein
MTRFQDKSEQEQREEARGLILMYAKSNGDPVPTEDQLKAAVEEIMTNVAITTPAYAVADGSLRR